MNKIFEELKRRHVIKASIAYLVIAWVLLQVFSILLPMFNTPQWVLKTITLLMAVGFPIWIIISWIYEVTPDGIKKTKSVNQGSTKSPHINIRLNKLILVSLSIAIAFILYNQLWNKPTSETVIKNGDVKSVAVLAFTNMSSDKDQDYFCDGIAEDILNDLVYIEGLKVASRTSSFAFKGKNIDIREIGKKLDVNTILEGSVQKSGNTLRITAQLTNVADGYHLWSKRYEKELEDIFDIQNEIAQNIVQALKIKLSTEEKSKLLQVKTQNIKAYDFYIRGRNYFNKTHQDKVILALPMFKKAIEIDENYALAYAGLADCYSEIYMYFDRTDENLQQALIASKKALELDSQLAETHSARGLALAQNNQYEEAEKEFKSAIQLNPKLFDAYYQYGRMFKSLGKQLKAAEQFKKAAQIDPDNYQPFLFLTSSYKDLNMETEMLEANKQTLQVLKNHIDFNPDDARALYLGAGALIKANEPEEALEWIEKAVLINPNEISVLYNATCIYSLLGKIDLALEYFDKAIEAGFASRNWLDNDTDLDNIRNLPRFQTILMKMK